MPCLLLFQQLFGITHPLSSEENQVFLPKRWQKILDAGKIDGQEANCAPCKAAAVLALTQMRWKQTLKDCAAEVQIEDEEDVKMYCPQGKKKREKK